MRRSSAWPTWLLSLLAVALLAGTGCVHCPLAAPTDTQLTQNAADTTTDPSAQAADTTDVASNANDQAAAATTGTAPVQNPAGTNSPACIQEGDPATPLQQAMFDALNQYRAVNGVAPLIYSKTLEAAGDAQVKDLWVRDFFSHINPDGLNPGQRAVAAGFCHEYVGENLAAGQSTLQRVMTAWENSPGHNANMLEPAYVYVGVSYSVDTNGRYYWAQEFAYELP